MRLLLTADPHGGVWDYALTLAAGLAELDVDVALATRGGAPSRAQRREALRIPGLEIFPGRHRLEWMQEPWDELAAAADWLLDLAEWLRPDVVHLNDYAHGALAWPCPVVVVAHSCVLSWWEAVRRERPPPEWRRYGEAVRRGLRGADAVVTPTRAMLRTLERHYGALPGARVVPNGRDPLAFEPGGKEPFVLAAGRLWDEAKNAAALAEVAPRISWPIFAVGPLRGPDGQEAPPGLDRLECLGALRPPALRRWLSRAALFAHPARYEPFGLCVLEAALSGCALILGDLPSLRELWDGAALFAPPDDTEAIAAALAALIDNEARRELLAASARARAFDLGAHPTARAYRSLYAELVLSAGPLRAMGSSIAEAP